MAALHVHGDSDATMVDVVSPANRTTSQGRQAYLTTRKDARCANASMVEIDLVLQGQPMLDYSRENLPDWDYAVTVTRATQVIHPTSNPMNSPNAALV